MAEEFVLEMNHITKTYGSNTVLKDVSLKVRPGEIHALLGENGAGKSTLMNVLFGMPVIHSTGGFEGEVRFDGEPVQIMSPMDAMEKGIGMVHQEFMLIPGFSITDNIKLNRELTKSWPVSKVLGKELEFLDREAMARDAKKALKAVGMNIEEYARVSGLPIGHMQFIEIAREIDKTGMKLLVFDEPTAVLTESEAEQLLSVMKQIAAGGIAIIFITHRLDEVMEAADTITILRDGALVTTIAREETTPEKLAALMIGRGEEGAIHIEKPPRMVNLDKETECAMTIRNLWVNMPGETVKGVDLRVRKGEILGIGGLAGQGKIGIPNGIMGLYEAGGKVTFDGNEIPLNNPRKCLDSSFAFVSEDRRGVGLLLDESLEWNVAFPAMQIQNKFLKYYLGGLVKWRDEKAIREVTEKYIDELKIKCTSSKQNARELSGGNQQKICLAKAFALEPRVLFVSEPTRGIDVGAKALVLDALKKFNRENGVTVVMISSELEELRQTCDRIAIVSGGKISGILPASSSVEELGTLMLSNVI